MPSQKQDSRIIFVLAICILVAILALGAYWWNVEKSGTSPFASQQQSPEPSTPDTGAGAANLLLATRIDMANERSDDSDRDMPYDLLAVNSQTLTSQKLGSIRVNLFSTPFDYRDGGIYFINGEGELSVFKLDTKSTERVAIPGIKPVFGFLDDNSVYDFLLAGDGVIYLQGSCMDGGACNLREYNFTTKKTSTILDGLEKKLPAVGEMVVNLQSYDPATKTVTLLKTRNTGGAGGFVDVIAISTETRKPSTVKTVEFSDDPAENTVAEEVYWKRLTCGYASAIQRYVEIPDTGDSDIQTDVVSGGKSMTYRPSHIAGCQPATQAAPQATPTIP